MRIPDSARIGPFTYGVEYHEGLIADDGKGLFGQADHVKHAIRISRFATPDHHPVTFLHEVLHVIDEVYDLDLKERQVDVLAAALVSFLKDNGFIE